MFELNQMKIDQVSPLPNFLVGQISLLGNWLKNSDSKYAKIRIKSFKPFQNHPILKMMTLLMIMTTITTMTTRILLVSNGQKLKLKQRNPAPRQAAIRQCLPVRHLRKFPRQFSGQFLAQFRLQFI